MASGSSDANQIPRVSITDNSLLDDDTGYDTPEDVLTPTTSEGRIRKTHSVPEDMASYLLKPKSHSDPSSSDISLADALTDKPDDKYDALDEHKNQQGIYPSLSDENLSVNHVTSISTIANISTWWKRIVNERRSNKRKKHEQAEELRMRHKLQYHFMTPFQKYKLGRKPWKLGVQVLKIIIVTTQVILFGADRFAAVAFMKHTQKAFTNIFVRGYDGNEQFSYYSRVELVKAIRYAHEQYMDVRSSAIGRYWYPSKNQSQPEPMKFCEEFYVKSEKNSSSGNINYYSGTTISCQVLSNNTNLDEILKVRTYFDRIKSLQLKFRVNGIYLNGLKLRHRPECFLFWNNIYIDNSKHDGRLRVSLRMANDLISCPHEYTIPKSAVAVKDILIAFDFLVISICALSLTLCVRSLTKSILLAKAAQRYFMEYKKEVLSKWDLFELINKWFGVIVFSDLLSIIGSIYKIKVDERDIKYYNICSVLLGVGVVAVWVGLLRFFTYVQKYNILLITLRSAAPSLARFMCCAMFIFFGFTFCGWIVLGPYHVKFVDFLTTAECLFSLLNGDDMYPTFATMSRRSTAIWIFSKIYIYVFVSLFIYVVLSTFISIVGDTYERLKDYGRMPPTRIEIFMTGKGGLKRPRNLKNICNRCLREGNLMKYPSIQSDSGTGISQFGSLSAQRSLSTSQLSIVSASLE